MRDVPDPLARVPRRGAATVFRDPVPPPRAGALLALAALLGCGWALPGCVPPQLLTLRSGLDSLRAVVDTMSVRDSVTYRQVQDMRREVAEQRDILLMTRATTGTTAQEMFQQMERLGGKLDEVMGRFQQINQRNQAELSAANANQLYDQAAQDLTQGRYPLALQEFRDFVAHFPTLELSDNAQYGIGECLFAQSKFDSAAVEYAKVEATFPQGDKVPAALYKLALCQEKLGQTAEAKKTLEDLVKRFPLSGEAQLARERLGTARRR
ncbi:MAG: tol-pal system protein YbgF [Candidatus Eisenbacteria bacterium]|uniref:Tol-pal system protein YbgF n=1 Tax=Eiseniibacteriota bacterium TaxID=2212470 RepID=A0A538SPZ2_UNCEI|nr:MAG: tol-pal system protein YbgF [Candidatus Eisenbacteria bacterium]